MTRAEEVELLRLAGRAGWRPVASRHGKHAVVRTAGRWEVRRTSMLGLTAARAGRDGWTVATTRFPDCFLIRPLGSSDDSARDR